MSDEQQKEKRPLSMTRRYRRGLVIVGLLCMMVTLAIATVLFQRSYTVRVDKYLSQICDSVAAGYKAQPTHDAVTLANLLPESDTSLRFSLIDGGGTVLYDSEAAAGVVYDKDGKVYAVDAPDLPSHADRPEFIAAMADGSASATRESQTMQKETHYYARRIVTPEGTQVLRVGEDVANIWGLSADTLPLLCGAVVVILLATAVLAWWLTRRLVQPMARRAAISLALWNSSSTETPMAISTDSAAVTGYSTDISRTFCSRGPTTWVSSSSHSTRVRSRAPALGCATSSFNSYRRADSSRFFTGSKTNSATE